MFAALVLNTVFALPMLVIPVPPFPIGSVPVTADVDKFTAPVAIFPDVTALAVISASGIDRSVS